MSNHLGSGSFNALAREPAAQPLFIFGIVTIDISLMIPPSILAHGQGSELARMLSSAAASGLMGREQRLFLESQAGLERQL